MKKITFFLLLLIFFGCSTTEDDTNVICNSDCTTFQGRFVTMNNEGLSGVKIELEYKIGGGIYSSHVRKILKTSTDESGNFYKKFYILDKELGLSGNGFFKVNIDDSSLNVENYILTYNLIDNSITPLDYGIPIINIRDTIIGNTFYLPKKTFITVKLNNFEPIQEGDYFSVRTLYPFGQHVGDNEFFNSEFSTGFGPTLKANGQNSQLNPFVAENEENMIQIARRKNGLNTIENLIIFVPSNNSIELNYDY